MKKLVLLIALLYLGSPANGEEVIPPDAPKHPHEISTHGDVRIDDYYWMRERDNPKVIGYLEAENAYTAVAMSDTNELQEQLFDEMVARLDPAEESVPFELNGYWYYQRYEEGLDYPIYCRRKGSMNAPEEVVVDANELAEGHNFFSLRGLTISSDNQMAAFAVDTIGRRQYAILFRDLESGKFIESGIVDVTSNLVWAEGSRVLFYTAQDPDTLRWHQVWRHELEKADDDELVFHEEDEQFYVYITKTKSRKFLAIASMQNVTTEFHVLPADNPMGDWQVFEAREHGHEYELDHAKDRWVIRSNWEAKNFRLMEVSGNETSRSAWQELVPHRKDVLLESFELFKDYLVVAERQNGLPQLVVIPTTGSSYEISFDDPTYSAFMTDNLEIDTATLRFNYTSLTTPMTTYDFDLETGERELKKQIRVLGSFDSADYASEYLYARARDGKAIPISLVYRKDKLNRGANPLLLYSYGSYGASSWAAFNSERVSLLDRGFAWAIAHVRGGQELGRDWYEDGKLLNKRNTFTDFIDSAHFLKQSKWADPDRTYGMGGSAGGLLIGSAVNMAPDEFHGAIAAVPFVDVVTTMLDDSIPLTTYEWDEWGDPRDRQYYDYMLSYSPYDQVRAQDYPNLLVTSGLHDSQVQYWEPAKWMAKLRDLNTGDNLLLLHTNMEAGHGGASGRLKRHRETARHFAFLLSLAGLDDQ